jgi:cyclohexanone monooxygenase
MLATLDNTGEFLAGVLRPGNAGANDAASPSVLSNVVVSIEQHVEWIAEHIEYLRKHDITTTEVERSAQDDWVAHVNEVAGRTLMLKAASWYLGANVPGKPRVFMPYVGGVGNYRKTCDSVADDGYRGFTLS